MRKLLDWLCLAAWHPHLLFARRRDEGDDPRSTDELRQQALTDVRMRALLDRNLRIDVETDAYMERHDL